MLSNLERNISEQRHDITVILGTLGSKPIITKRDCKNIAAEIADLIDEIFTSAKFYKRYFNSDLISPSTKIQLAHVAYICNNIKLHLKKKKKKFLGNHFCFRYFNFSFLQAST